MTQHDNRTTATAAAAAVDFARRRRSTGRWLGVAVVGCIVSECSARRMQQQKSQSRQTHTHRHTNSTTRGGLIVYTYAPALTIFSHLARFASSCRLRCAQPVQPVCAPGLWCAVQMQMCEIATRSFHAGSPHGARLLHILRQRIGLGALVLQFID